MTDQEKKAAKELLKAYLDGSMEEKKAALRKEIREFESLKKENKKNKESLIELAMKYGTIRKTTGTGHNYLLRVGKQQVSVTTNIKPGYTTGESTSRKLEILS